MAGAWFICWPMRPVRGLYGPHLANAPRGTNYILPESFELLAAEILFMFRSLRRVSKVTHPLPYLHGIRANDFSTKLCRHFHG